MLMQPGPSYSGQRPPTVEGVLAGVYSKTETRRRLPAGRSAAHGSKSYQHWRVRVSGGPLWRSFLSEIAEMILWGAALGLPQSPRWHHGLEPVQLGPARATECSTRPSWFDCWQKARSGMVWAGVSDRSDPERHGSRPNGSGAHAQPHGGHAIPSAVRPPGRPAGAPGLTAELGRLRR